MQSLQANCLAKIKQSKEICSSIVVGVGKMSRLGWVGGGSQGARNSKALEEKRREKNMANQVIK